MTHTLHPEIEEAIDKIKKEYDDYEVGEYDEGDYGYSRGLLRSIQILKDIPLLNDKEPLPEYTTTINTKELEALKIKARKYDELCK